MNGESRRYDDIIHRDHHVSDRRPRMSVGDRAAQFSPFAALTGFEAAISETGRLTDGRIELGEDGKAMLDEKLRRVFEQIQWQPQVQLVHFQPDSRKAGGAYLSCTGRVKRIDQHRRTIFLSDGTAIHFDNLYDISLL